MTLPTESEIFVLYSWCSLAKFRSVSDALISRLTDPEFLVKSSEGAKALREAFVLARFSAARSATGCRLASDRGLDGEMCIDKKTCKVEITELLHDGRKRGDEFRNGRAAFMIGEEVLKAISRDWTHWFLKSVQKKSDLYQKSTGTELIVYNNLSFFRSLHELPLLRDALIRKFENEHPIFNSVWHFRPDKTHQVWPHFESYEVPNWHLDI
jgi:hypothetical protein